jgi:cytochrome c-type biogenesis protein CcmH/NrfG
MNSLYLFWALTGLLSLLVLPFLYRFLLVAPGIIGVTYLLYSIWGSPAGLSSYYSKSQEAHRLKQADMRPLLVQFRKAEQRYLLRIETDPNDREAWLNLGQIYLIQQDEARAAYAFAQARKSSD